jgi:hypothetical protein
MYYAWFTEPTQPFKYAYKGITYIKFQVIQTRLTKSLEFSERKQYNSII